MNAVVSIGYHVNYSFCKLHSKVKRMIITISEIRNNHSLFSIEGFFLRHSAYFDNECFLCFHSVVLWGVIEI